MNGKVLSVKSFETLGFGSTKRVEQMSQWAQRPAMALVEITPFFMERRWRYTDIHCLHFKW